MEKGSREQGGRRGCHRGSLLKSSCSSQGFGAHSGSAERTRCCGTSVNTHLVNYVIQQFKDGHRRPAVHPVACVVKTTKNSGERRQGQRRASFCVRSTGVLREAGATRLGADSRLQKITKRKPKRILKFWISFTMPTAQIYFLAWSIWREPDHLLWQAGSASRAFCFRANGASGASFKSLSCLGSSRRGPSKAVPKKLPLAWKERGGSWGRV